ncbi:MAG: hypothetical protein Kow0022_09590 [Phycisphaerales bacterium]
MLGIRTPVSVLASASLLVTLPACQGSRKHATLDGYNAGLAVLAGEAEGLAVPSREAAQELLASDGSSLSELIDASTRALDELFESDLAPLLSETDEPRVFEAPSPVTPADDGSASESVGLEALGGETNPDVPSLTEAHVPQLSELAKDIVDAIVAGLGSSEHPLEDALALLGLDTLVPGAADAPTEHDVLSPAERTQFEAARSLLDAIRTGEDDPDAAADAAEQIALDLADQMPLRLDRAELCSRVDGYGQYTRFEGNTFVAGRPHRVILYVELSRFGHTVIPGTDGEPRFAVDLTQRVEIYHEPDGVLAMATPTLADRRVSRNRFRDYYVVTALDLPATLSVGRYGIRVTMRDRSDDSVAEVVVPLTIVADSSALPN